MMMLLDAMLMSKYRRKVSLMAASLPLIAAQPTSHPSTSSGHQIGHDYQDDRRALFKRSEAQSLTAVVVGTTVSVGVFILVLLCIALYMWRKNLLHGDDRNRPASSPREHIYREQRKHKRSRSRNTRKGEGRHTRRASHEKRTARSNSHEQPSSTAASIASSFSPARPSTPTPPQMVQIPPSRFETSRFRPPVALPPLMTETNRHRSIDATLDSTRPNESSRWSMSTLGMSLLRDTMQSAEPERYSDSSPSTRYQENTPSGYAPSPFHQESSPAKRVTFALAELPGCDGQSSSPYWYNPSPETPQGWTRGPSEDDLVTPILPRHLATSEIDGRQVTCPLNTIYEDRESVRHGRI